ncbi:hypothetical protein Tco_0078429 [Tanacetum coccineum]
MLVGVACIPQHTIADPKHPVWLQNGEEVVVYGVLSKRGDIGAMKVVMARLVSDVVKQSKVLAKGRGGDEVVMVEIGVLVMDEMVVGRKSTAPEKLAGNEREDEGKYGG